MKKTVCAFEIVFPGLWAHSSGLLPPACRGKSCKVKQFCSFLKSRRAACKLSKRGSDDELLLIF